MSSKRKNKNKLGSIKINKIDLFINSSDKLGRHDPKVRRGCGVIDKSQYTRKEKHKKDWKKF